MNFWVIKLNGKLYFKNLIIQKMALLQMLGAIFQKFDIVGQEQ